MKKCFLGLKTRKWQPLFNHYSRVFVLELFLIYICETLIIYFTWIRYIIDYNFFSPCSWDSVQYFFLLRLDYWKHNALQNMCQMMIIIWRNLELEFSVAFFVNFKFAEISDKLSFENDRNGLVLSRKGIYFFKNWSSVYLFLLKRDLLISFPHFMWVNSICTFLKYFQIILNSDFNKYF